MVKVSVAVPLGTLSTKNCCEPREPLMLVMATPFVRTVSPLAAVTVIDAVAVWAVPPELPVTVKVAVVAAAEEDAVTVKVELPPAVTVAGLNEPLTPEGRPLTDRARLWVLPLMALVVTV
jgi:hypothetical protein